MHDTWTEVRVRNAEARTIMRTDTGSDAVLEEVLAAVVADMLRSVCEEEVHQAAASTEVPAAAPGPGRVAGPTPRQQPEKQGGSSDHTQPPPTEGTTKPAATATTANSSLQRAVAAAAAAEAAPEQKRTANSSLQQAAAAAFQDMVSSNPFAQAQRAHHGNPWAALTVGSMANASHAVGETGAMVLHTMEAESPEDVDIIDDMEEDDAVTTSAAATKSTHQRRGLALRGRPTSRISKQLSMALPVSKQLGSGKMGSQAVKAVTAKAQANIQQFLRHAPPIADTDVCVVHRRCRRTYPVRGAS